MPRIQNYVLFLAATLVSTGQLVGGSPLGFPPLPFIRGGSATTTATKSRTTKQQQRQRRHHHRGNLLPGPLELIGNVKQGLDKIGDNMQNDWKKFSRGMQTVQGNIGKLVVNISRALPFLPPRKRQLKCSKLDDVCNTFSACLKGS